LSDKHKRGDRRNVPRSAAANSIDNGAIVDEHDLEKETPLAWDKPWKILWEMYNSDLPVPE
jgi:hypothetical protein